MKVVTVKLYAGDIQFQLPNNEDCLLAILEKYTIKVEYQCRSGYCGVCRLKLVRGKVIYYKLPIALINHGEILPCCCRPLTDIELYV